jgi:hypothetical protein
MERDYQEPRKMTMKVGFRGPGSRYRAPTTSNQVLE